MQQFPRGTRVGPFLLQEELSSAGNMAWVYRAITREHANRHVALKIARSDGQYYDVFERLLRNETRLLADLRHPGIVHIYPIKAYGRSSYVGRAKYLADYFGGEAPWYFPMELLRGGSLEVAMERLQGFALAWKLELVYQIAVTLDYLHLRDIAHLDLKPSNIVFREPPEPHRTPQPVLIDFGIAEKRALQQQDKAATLMYASPERVEEITGHQSILPTSETSEINHLPADVWSLGIIAYELLGSKYPFGNVTRKTALSQRILNDDPPPLNGVPTEVNELVRWMLTRVREQRPAINHVIARLDTELPITPPRVSSPQG